jgi:hypothetical protein
MGIAASMAAWGANIQYINTFLTERPAYIRQHLSASFEKSDSALVTCQVTAAVTSRSVVCRLKPRNLKGIF